jgi:hypothetical protein
MTTSQSSELIGKTGTLMTRDGLLFTVKIVDVKNSYGIDRLKISPVSGSGETWVNATSLIIQEGEKAK